MFSKVYQAYFFYFVLMSSVVSATQTTKHFDQRFGKAIKLIDIRTEEEWKKTGVIAGSIPVSYFDRNGKKNSLFVQRIDNLIQDKEPFAIICLSGGRSGVAAEELSGLGYDVINVKGGLIDAKGRGATVIAWEK